MAIPFERLEGKYEILEKMREGGMGALYKVRHRLLEEVRVIKVMRPQLADDEVLKARFLREAKTAIRLRHANLAQIYDFTVDEEGAFYLVMEFIDGPNLQETVRAAGRFSLAMALEIAHQTLGVLGYLHRKEIVHRDISPDNLLLTLDDEDNPLVKLIDLGIAKVPQSEDNLTATGTFLGKVRYSSPESFRSKDADEVGPRSDLYSFGVVLYELLTGVYPIRGSTISGLIAGHLMHPPMPFAESDPDGHVPEDVRETVLRILAKEADDRFPSARAFRTKIGELKDLHPLDADEARRLVEAVRRTPPTMAIPVPVSVQQHLDHNFGVTTTPSHGTDSLPGTPAGALDTQHTAPPETPPARRTPAGPGEEHGLRHQVRALLLGAEKLVQAHHYDEARLQLNAALELDPDNTEVSRLLAALDAADQKLLARRSEAAAELRELIAAEELDTATERLAAAVQRLGSGGPLEEARVELEAARRAFEARQEKLRGLLDEAASLRAAGRLKDAVGCLGRAVELAPEHADARRLLAEAELELGRQRERERRLEEISKAMAAISGHIDAEHADEAARAITLARKLYGEAGGFAELEERLAELRRSLRRRQAEAMLDTAAGHIEARDFAAAIDLLQRLAAELPDDRRLLDLMAAAHEGQRLEEEARQRRTAIDETALAIDRLILAGRLETAVRYVDRSIEELGAFAEAKVMRERIEREQTARRVCQERADGALEKVRNAIEGGELERAELELSRAREQAASHPEVAVAVDDAAAELRKLLEERKRRRAVEEAVTSVERRLDEGDVDSAERELEVAGRLYGRERAFEELRRRAEELRRQQRAATVERLLREALGRQASFSEAIARLEEARKLDPDNEKVQRLLAEIHGAQQRLREDRRAKDVAAAMTEVDALVAAGDLESALAAVAAAVKRIGQFPEARTVRLRLEAALRRGADAG